DVWREFWKATDPVPLTPENEAVDDYFRRVQQANIRFPDEGQPGWLTERGEVFITLGEPDEMTDLSSGIDRNGTRLLRWTYAAPVGPSLARGGDPAGRRAARPQSQRIPDRRRRQSRSSRAPLRAREATAGRPTLAARLSRW